MPEAYATVAASDSYFLTECLDREQWIQASENRRQAALYQATRLIDNLNFVGTKTDEDQELEFPRDDDEDVPRDIEIACMEIAYALLDGRDVELEAEQVGEVAASLGPGRLRVEPDMMNEAKAHNVPSIVAWRHLKPYLRRADTVTLSRVD